MQDENQPRNVKDDANLNFEVAKKKLRKQNRFCSNNSDESLPKKRDDLSNNQPRCQDEFQKSLQSSSPIPPTQRYTNSVVTESLGQRVDRILAIWRGVDYFPASFQDLKADKNAGSNQMDPGLTSIPVSPNRKMFKLSEQKENFSRKSSVTWPHQQTSPSDSGYLSSHLDIPKENSETLNSSSTCWRHTTEDATCLDSKLNQNHEFSTESESYYLSQGTGFKDQMPVEQTRASQQSLNNPLRETKIFHNNNPKSCQNQNPKSCQNTNPKSCQNTNPKSCQNKNQKKTAEKQSQLQTSK